LTFKLRKGNPKKVAIANSVLTGAVTGIAVADLISWLVEMPLISILLGTLFGYLLARSVLIWFFAGQTKRASYICLAVLAAVIMAFMPTLFYRVSA